MRRAALVGVFALLVVLSSCSSGHPVSRPPARRPIAQELAVSTDAATDRPLPTVPHDATDTVDPRLAFSTEPTPTTPPPPPREEILPSDVLFDTDSAELKPAAVPVLKDLAARIIRETPHARVIITGHTDSRGSSGHNQALSFARGNTVAVFLVAGGIPAASVSSTGAGESTPLVDDDPGGRYVEEAGARNRRVEIRVLPNG